MPCDRSFPPAYEMGTCHILVHAREMWSTKIFRVHILVSGMDVGKTGVKQATAKESSFQMALRPVLVYLSSIAHRTPPSTSNFLYYASFR